VNLRGTRGFTDSEEISGSDAVMTIATSVFGSNGGGRLVLWEHEVAAQVKGARILGFFGNSKRERGIVTNNGFGCLSSKMA